MVKLAGVSRASFYRFAGEARPGPDTGMDLRDAIQRIALEWPSYGRPRITAELRRRGLTVNPKKGIYIVGKIGLKTSGISGACSGMTPQQTPQRSRHVGERATQ
jgi:hypothetical protein